MKQALDTTLILHHGKTYTPQGYETPQKGDLYLTSDGKIKTSGVVRDLTVTQNNPYRLIVKLVKQITFICTEVKGRQNPHAKL